MDGFTALGIAANICQFIEYGFKIVNQVKNVRHAGQLDPDLDRDTRHLKVIASKLTAQSLPPHSGQIGTVAADCVKLSDDLLNELYKSKPKDSKSKWQSFKAVVRTEYKKRDVAELENKLERCRSQLTLQLTDILRQASIPINPAELSKLTPIRIETTERLDEIINSGRDIQDELKSLRSAMDALRPAVNATYVGEDIAGMLRSFMSRSEEALSRVRRMLILNVLRFPNVHERYDDIAEAHEDTFNWMFDKDDECNSDALSASTASTTSSIASTAPYIHSTSLSQMVARDSFVSWLENGSGFFHISGKPGAGKSTLMRYISLHPNLRNHLQIWCQGRELALGSFFFWRPGSVEQKSIKGLLRGLLFSILESSPGLIPVAFPSLWEISLVHPAAIPTLEHRDILEAFRNVLAGSNHVGSFKFAFFIDGLDEFEGRHAELINTMRAWMAKYPESVKCCVSSREYIIFEEAFSHCPRIRLHELTQNDIATMVHGRLKSIGNSSTLNPKDLQPIKELIIERAAGVFLWVSLVLGTVEEGLLSGDDVCELDKKVRLCPTELEALFQHLLTSIHRGDRDWAFSVLVWVQYLRRRAEKVETILTGIRHRAGGTLSLLQLSALDISNHAPADSKRNTKKNTVRADNLARDMRRKVYGRCKGLLEVRVNRQPKVNDLHDHVAFTHRSIVEFLETPPASELMAQHTRNFDPFQATCQALMACIKHIPSGSDWITFLDRERFKKVDQWYINKNLYELLVLSIIDDRSGSMQFLEFLDTVRCTIMDDLPAHFEHASGLIGPFELLVLKTLSCGVYEYIEWARSRSIFPTIDPSHNIEVYQRAQAFRMLKFSTRGQDRVSISPNFSVERFTHVLGHFLTLGNGLNTVWELSIPPYLNINWSLWENTLWDLIMDINLPREWDCGTIMDWFLRNGADPEVTICNFRHGEILTIDWLEPKEGWIAFEPLLEHGDDFKLPAWVTPPERAFSNDPHKYIILVRESSPIFQSAAKNNMALNLREFLTIWLPDDVVHFHQLIDSLSGVDFDKRPETPLPITRKVKATRDILGRVWGIACPKGCAMIAGGIIEHFNLCRHAANDVSSSAWVKATVMYNRVLPP